MKVKFVTDRQMILESENEREKKFLEEVNKQDDPDKYINDLLMELIKKLDEELKDESDKA